MLRIRQATLNDLEILLEFEQLLIDYERTITSHIKDGHINYYDIESFINPFTSMLFFNIHKP